MEVINIKKSKKYLKEYIKLCSLEWGKSKTKEEMNKYILKKENEILNGDKVISIIGIRNDDILIGFISLFMYEGDERKDLFPWYATMYVKEEYRGHGYSKILNDLVLDEARNLGYKKLYLKSELINYYEKFGAIPFDKLSNGETLYYIDL